MTRTWPALAVVLLASCAPEYQTPAYTYVPPFDPKSVRGPAPPRLFENEDKPPVSLAPAVTLTRPRQPSRPTIAATSGAYCAEAGVLAQMDSNPSVALPEIQRACKLGDSIALPTFATAIIATACDNGKPVNTAGPSVYCTLGPIRAIRRAQ